MKEAFLIIQFQNAVKVIDKVGAAKTNQDLSAYVSGIFLASKISSVPPPAPATPATGEAFVFFGWVAFAK